MVSATEFNAEEVSSINTFLKYVKQERQDCKSESGTNERQHYNTGFKLMSSVIFNDDSYAEDGHRGASSATRWPNFSYSVTQRIFRTDSPPAGMQSVDQDDLT